MYFLCKIDSANEKSTLFIVLMGKNDKSFLGDREQRGLT